MDTSNFEIYYKLGHKDKHWYEDHQKELETIYGKERLHLVCQLFAATSINSSLKSNIRLFRKALHEITNNKEFSSYLPVMRLQLDRIRAGEPINGRKIKNFAAALSGDTQAVVVDIWLLRAFGLDRKYTRSLSGRPQSGGASDADYTKIENWVKEKAGELNMEPRQLSAIVWSGCRIYHTNDRDTQYLFILKQQLYNMFETH